MVCLYLTAQLGASGLHTVCIGLGRCFQDRNIKVGYIKPLGHRYYEEEGKVTDEDAAFMRRTLNLEEDLDDLCPVVLSPQLIRNSFRDGPEDLLDIVKKALFRIGQNKDVVLVQGSLNSNQIGRAHV